MAQYGSIWYDTMIQTIFTYVATNDWDSSTVGQSEWKAVFDQLAFTVMLRLICRHCLSSGLVRDLEMSTGSPPKLVDKRTLIAQPAAYNTALYHYITAAEAMTVYMHHLLVQTSTELDCCEISC